MMPTWEGHGVIIWKKFRTRTEFRSNQQQNYEMADLFHYLAVHWAGPSPGIERYIQVLACCLPDCQFFSLNSLFSFLNIYFLLCIFIFLSVQTHLGSFLPPSVHVICKMRNTQYMIVLINLRIPGCQCSSCTDPKGWPAAWPAGRSEGSGSSPRCTCSCPRWKLIHFKNVNEILTYPLPLILLMAET